MPRRRAERVAGSAGLSGRAAILRGAGRAFSEKGYRATTMHDIAAAAGYTPPTLYSYFDGKEDILRSLIDDLVSELIEAFEQSDPPELSFEARLDNLLTRHQKIAEGHRDALVFLMRMGHGTEATAGAEGDNRAYQRRMVRWMRDVQKETGELQQVPATTLALVLTSLFEGFLCDWARRGGRRPLRGLVKQIKELFLDGVRGQRGP